MSISTHEEKTMIEFLKKELTQAENRANDLEIDQIAWLISSFSKDHWLHEHINPSEHPRISKLLTDMKPYTMEPLALMRVLEYANREDTVGLIARLSWFSR